MTDFHPAWQQVAVFDSATGEIRKQKLEKGFRRDQHIVSTRTDARRVSYFSIHKPIHKMLCLRRLEGT